MESNDFQFPSIWSRVHELKIWPDFFAQVISGVKPFEVRRNDREFKTGDVLKLCEWDPDKKSHTGRFCFRRVTCILDDLALDAKDPGVIKEGYVVLGLGRVL